MKSLIRTCRTRPGLASLAAAILALAIFTGPAEAMFVPAAPHQATTTGAAAEPEERAADLARIQALLESRIIRQKLMDYGLSPEDSMAQMNKLSDAQINLFATHAASIQAGGDRGVSLVVLLLIIILVVLIV